MKNGRIVTDLIGGENNPASRTGPDCATAMPRNNHKAAAIQLTLGPLTNGTDPFGLNRLFLAERRQ